MDFEQRLKRVEQGLEAINEEYYNKNFSAFQEFTKYSNFTTRLKVPSYSTLPSVCEVGEIVESSGKLHICSAANTWTIVGNQTT